MDKRKINYAGRVFDGDEKKHLLEAVDDMWLTYGRFTKQFEKGLAEFIGTKYCHFVNSGSSANLLAIAALTSPLLGDRRLKPGDEVITTALCFPTTVAPIIQCGAVPVFVDVYEGYPNANPYYFQKALTSKTKAVFLAHTLGMPFELTLIKSFCKKHNLWLIEDNCDALGSQYVNERGIWAYTGTFGDISTTSFYPAHMITTGQGGAVFTDDPLLSKIVVSMKDWGRDCECPSGHDGVCGKRYTQEYKNLPQGFDHKYVYSHLGYNCAATDLQASIGVAQLKKLPEFIKKRKENFIYLKNNLTIFLGDKLLIPTMTEHSDPCWFGLTIKVISDDPLTRSNLVKHLENSGIQTRMLFAGNIICQPCFDHLEKGKDYRVIEDMYGRKELLYTDDWMNDSFFIGVYPGLNQDDLDYMIEKIFEFYK